MARCGVVTGAVALAVGLLRGTFIADLARLGDRNVLGFTAASVVVFTAANTAIFLSIAAKNATVAGLVEISYPVFIALFAWLVLRETQLTAGVAAGAALIFAGVVLVLLKS